MPHTLQDFLATATQKAAADLAEAFANLPEDSRGWKPETASRPAFDLVGECAILNGYTANLIQTRLWSPDHFKTYDQDKTEAIALGWEALHALMMENARKVASVISAVPETVLADEIEMPGSKQTVSQIMAYPYWNMTYHLGQVNYIASLLERLA